MVSIDFEDYKPLLVIKDDKTGRRILQRDYKIIIDGEMLVIPCGFDTDYSSYPWLTRSIVRFDRVDIAGVVHDYLYRYQNRARSEADRVWRLIAQHGENSANAAQAWTSWFGLRLFGWLSWNEHKNEIQP